MEADWRLVISFGWYVLGGGTEVVELLMEEKEVVVQWEKGSGKLGVEWAEGSHKVVVVGLWW